MMALTYARVDPLATTANVSIRVVEPPDPGSEIAAIEQAFRAASYGGVCRGISVGCCVQTLGVGIRKNAAAHAHNNNRHDDYYYGWICVRLRRSLLGPDGQPSGTMWHELAHLLAPNSGHGDAWRAWMIDLGQTLEPRYARRTYTRWLCPPCGNKIRTMDRTQWTCGRCRQPMVKQA